MAFTVTLGPGGVWEAAPGGVAPGPQPPSLPPFCVPGQPSAGTLSMRCWRHGRRRSPPREDTESAAAGPAWRPALGPRRPRPAGASAGVTRVLETGFSFRCFLGGEVPAASAGGGAREPPPGEDSRQQGRAPRVSPLRRPRGGAQGRPFPPGRSPVKKPSPRTASTCRCVVTRQGGAGEKPRAIKIYFWFLKKPRAVHIRPPRLAGWLLPGQLPASGPGQTPLPLLHLGDRWAQAGLRT